MKRSHITLWIENNIGVWSLYILVKNIKGKKINFDIHI